MSPENVCPRFKQNAWKKELCSNCFRPKEEHPEKPKRAHIDYKPLPEISPAQSILKANGSYRKSCNVSFSNIESEVIGYGGEEYSTDEEYSSDEENHSEYVDSGDDEELKRLTEDNTNRNSKLIIPEKTVDNNVLPKKSAAMLVDDKKPLAKSVVVENKLPPLVTVKPFGVGEPPKSLVFNFLKNKEIAAATAIATAAAITASKESQNTEKNETEDVQLRKTETLKKPTLTRSSLVANSNELYLNIKRCNLPTDNDPKPAPSVTMNMEIPKVKLHPPETIKTVENSVEENEVFSTKESDGNTSAGGGSAPYKTRSNVPRMGTMHFKLKLAVASSQKPEMSAKPIADPTPESSLTSREMAGEPDGKADSDEPGDPTTTPINRSFLHNLKDNSSPIRDMTTPPRTPPKKTSITSNSPPECPRSIKRQAPKPPPPPPSAKCTDQNIFHSANSSFSDEEFRPDDVTIANRKLLAEYCEQIEKEQTHQNHCNKESPMLPPPPTPTEVVVGDEATRDSSTIPLPSKRPSYEKKKYGKAGKVGLKIKKFLRIPSRESIPATPPPQPSPRPKLEIIHPLDINKSGVEIIHNNADGLYTKESAMKGISNYYAVRPTKPPPPPRSLPPIIKLPLKTVQSAEITDYSDTTKNCDSSASDETYEPINFSAPECDLHNTPEMARLTSMQYYGSETESEIYPTIQFGDDFGAEDSIRNTQPGHKSLEESYDAVVIANHEALTKLLDQATCGPKIPNELMALKTAALEWSNFRVDPTSRLRKSDCVFYNGRWYDVPVVLSVSYKQVKLNNVLNNHFTLTKVTQFATSVEKEFSLGAENEEVYVTLWNAHRIETVESYCKEYNAKHVDVTKEAGLILVETVNLLIGLQVSGINRYSLEPFVVTRNSFNAEPTIAVVQLETDFLNGDTLCEIMLKVLRLLAPTWEITVCLSQVLCQSKPNSLSKCKALLEFWLWGPTSVTVTPDKPMSLKRWLDLERANDLHGHVCSRSSDLSVKQICYMSFLVANDDDTLFSDAWNVLAERKTMRPPRDPTISKC